MGSVSGSADRTPTQSMHDLSISNQLNSTASKGVAKRPTDALEIRRDSEAGELDEFVDAQG